MIRLDELRSEDLKRILKLRQKIEIHERQIAEVLRNAEKKGPPLSVTIRSLRLPRAAQPSLRDLIIGILRKAGKPMSVSELLDESLSLGYQWRSQDPINALNVKMYTDEAFKKVSPGRFVLRKQGKDAP